MSQSVSALLGVGVLSFISTNLDDLLLLLILFSTPRLKKNEVILGQFIGMGFLIALSSLSSYLGTVIFPHEWLRYLGIMPIAMGAKKLICLWFTKKNKSNHHSLDIKSNIRFKSQFVSVALITLVNGGDNVAVYIPIFASHTVLDQIGLIIIYLSMTALWCWLAYFLTLRSQSIRVLQTYGEILFPFVLILLGIQVIIT
jgi:cadmium resistance protein CadD (predicted permease)